MIPRSNESSLIVRVKFLSSSNLLSSNILMQNSELLLPLLKVTLYGPVSLSPVAGNLLQNIFMCRAHLLHHHHNYDH